jgi:hypothetical protein
MTDWSAEEVCGQVDRMVEELLDAAGCQQPPVDACDIARRHLGLALKSRSDGGGRRTGLLRRGSLPAEPTSEARQWQAARQIAEHLRPRLLSALGLPPDAAAGGPSLLTLVASRLLVPTCWFAEDARELDFRLPELKQRYATASHELLAWRMLDLPQPCVITIVDNEHITRRRSNAWQVARQLLPAEKACLNYVHAYSRPRCVQAQGWTVYGWPVHQPDWKREILRSVYDE